MQQHDNLNHHLFFKQSLEDLLANKPKKTPKQYYCHLVVFVRNYKQWNKKMTDLTRLYNILTSE